MNFALFHLFVLHFGFLFSVFGDLWDFFEALLALGLGSSSSIPMHLTHFSTRDKFQLQIGCVVFSAFLIDNVSGECALIWIWISGRN